MPRRIFLDTEWTAPPWSPSAQLMWIGLADDDGRSWYGISAEAVISPASNPFVAGAFRLIRPDEPRLARAELAREVRAFCGEQVDAFWVWIPTVQSFAAFFHLGEAEGEALYRQYRDVDLQMLRSLVQPWPAGWAREVSDLHAAASEAGVPIPPRAPNHLHPRVHVEWNRVLMERIAAAGRG